MKNVFFLGSTDLIDLQGNLEEEDARDRANGVKTQRIIAVGAGAHIVLVELALF